MPDGKEPFRRGDILQQQGHLVHHRSLIRGILATSLVGLVASQSIPQAQGQNRATNYNRHLRAGFSLRRPFASLGWRYEPLAADLFVIAAIVILVARVQIGEALFTNSSGEFSS